MKKGIFEDGGPANFEKPPEGTRAADELENEVGSAELHNSNLFDQDETLTGEKVDLATGKPIDNSTFPPTEDLNIIRGDLDKVDNSNRNVWEIPVDDAEKWLMENDPLHPKYKGKGDSTNTKK